MMRSRKRLRTSVGPVCARVSGWLVIMLVCAAPAALAETGPGGTASGHAVGVGEVPSPPPTAALARSERQTLPVSIRFRREDLDTEYGGNGKPGWVRAGDMDGDGDVDVVAAGGGAMFVYENGGVSSPKPWRRWGSLSGGEGVNANGGALLDVDEDGDLDVISAPDESKLGWWENPGGPLRSGSWTFHRIASVELDTPFFLHDLILVDLDGDGIEREIVTNRDSRYWGGTILIRWHRALPGGGWETHAIEPGRVEGTEHGHAGLDVADLDGDGDRDLTFSNGWYENTGRLEAAWRWHPLSDVYGISNNLARDVNGDGRLDLVVSAGHHGQGVYWLEQPVSHPTSERWPRHPISAVEGDPTVRWHYRAHSNALHHPEGLQVLDLDEDGDLDVVTSELFFGEDPDEPGWSESVHNVYVYRNDGNATSPRWSVRNIAPDSYPSHLIQLADLNRDGRVDLISEGAGFGVVSRFENLPEPRSSPGLLAGIVGLRGLAGRRRKRGLAHGCSPSVRVSRPEAGATSTALRGPRPDRLGSGCGQICATVPAQRSPAAL